jgi:hypothetical protein
VLAQVGEQRCDLAGDVLVDSVQVQAWRLLVLTHPGE